MPRFLTRTHIEEISPEHTVYTARVEGDVDPFNEAVLIENTGSLRSKTPS
ncbi:MAG: hypothetical protein FJY97_11490 [candidate division Zixibacteria bacterium]|nr:hypothetical protein [candidate division Zixibacteria bacterium]